MSVSVLHTEAFEDNYIWLIVVDSPNAREPRSVIIIDPGDAAPVFEIISKENLKPVAVFCTHHHWDHVDGAGDLAERYSVPVYGPAAENIPVVTHPLKDGDSVNEPITGLTFQVISIPGHTRGHIAFYGHDMLFCGDTLFSAGCGRLFEGTAKQMLTSLTRLAALPDVTKVYCGHEYTADNLRFAATIDPDNDDIKRHATKVSDLRKKGHATLPSTIALEKTINPFLRTSTTAIKLAAEKHGDVELIDEVAVFAEVRQWKDHYRG